MTRKKSKARPHSTKPGAKAKPGTRNKTSASKGSVAAGKIAKSVVVVGSNNDVRVNAEKRRPSNQRKAYLEYVLQTVRPLFLQGIDRDDVGRAETNRSLNLDAIYTGLRTATPEQEAEKSGKTRLPSPSPKASISALAALDGVDRLVLLGDPGSGKSTFVAFVALCLAGEGLGRKDVNLKALTRPLPVEDGGEAQKKPKPQRWRHGALLPVRVVLRDFAARGLPSSEEKAKAAHLLAFIRHELPACCDGEFAPLLESELREKGGLVLLDGLDEVPEAGKRRNQINDAVVDFAAAFPKCRLLVTSRTYAYRKQGWALAGFTERELAPFSQGQIAEFIARWYQQVAQVRGLSSEEAQGRGRLLLDAIRAKDRLTELATRPLLLTLMASLHAWRGGRLPEDREELYGEAVDLLLDRWERNRLTIDKNGRTVNSEPSLTEWLRVGIAKVRDLLEELAFDAHGRQPELRGTADVPEEALVGGLLRMTKDPDLKPGHIVEYLNARAGLLVPRGEGVFTFPHRTFQEYLAACHLSRKGFPTTLAGLVRSDPERWREVALLAAAKVGGRRGSPYALWGLVERLIPADPVESEDTPTLLTALVAGQALAESLDVEHVETCDQPKLQRARAWLQKIVEGEVLPPLLRAQAGDALAAIGDPRFRDASEGCLPADDMFGFVEIPAGPFLMGSDKSRDGLAEDPETPQHQVELPDYLMARFPVTVAQFRSSGIRVEDEMGLKAPATRPMTRVSLDEALAYCAWFDRELRSRTDLPDRLRQALVSGKVMLPSEAEWEKAARGTDGRIYPWGDQWKPENANVAEAGIGSTSAVGCFRQHGSPFHCEDMSGGVFEWTRGCPQWYPYPVKPKERAKLEARGGYDIRVVRGGCFIADQMIARAAYRFINHPAVRYGYLVGFRVVVSPSISDP